MENGITLQTAVSPEQYEAGRVIFRAYAASLDFDLCFQGFEEELVNIAKQYGPPEGALILACKGQDVIGCVGVRKFAEGQSELKRMFVLPDYRRLKLGESLLLAALQAAKELGYSNMKLDTLPAMTSAIKLYEAHGFKKIAPYRYNPDEGAIYMEAEL
ncbi:GNAT family N-acetyltransferase [Chitinophaga deserti]|uniref:GNAT family N-acetyltransferase n=1 Tax=Chitinophaga deserti TaxID=2164099 RepID=UPI000D6A93B6|nr:GNAT family N-acetyltransferase [Chitinophaga deserti]